MISSCGEVTTVRVGFAPDTALGRAIGYLRTQPQPIHLVGGCVRDLLLGRKVHDLDVIVPHNASHLARRVADELGGAFVAIDPQRDTGRAVLAASGDEVVYVDCAAWRAPTLLEDLRLRDFTINALAAELERSETPVIDVAGGLADLQHRLVRVVSGRSLPDDPLRGLRAVRLVAELAFLGFRLETETTQELRRHAALLDQPAPERVRDELVRILSADSPHTWLQLMASLGQLAVVLPEAGALRGVVQTLPHRYDAFEHTMHVVDNSAWQMGWIGGQVQPAGWPDEIYAETMTPYRSLLVEHFAESESLLRSRAHMLLWAALAHDWGKPATRGDERASDGSVRIRFVGHEQVGAELAAQALRRLRFNEAEVRRVSSIVAFHLRPVELIAGTISWPSRRAVYRYFRDTGDAGVDVALLSLADRRGIHGAELDEGLWRRHLSLVAALLDAYFNRRTELVAPPPLLTGNDLKAHFGLQPGRHIGRLLSDLAEAQAAGEVQTRDEALAFIAHRLDGA